MAKIIKHSKDCIKLYTNLILMGFIKTPNITYLQYTKGFICINLFKYKRIKKGHIQFKRHMLYINLEYSKIINKFNNLLKHKNL